jgi:hypothetical protein
MSTEKNLEPAGRGDRTISTPPPAAGHGPGHGELPHHDTVSFESRDVQVRTIYWYLIALTISVAASFFVCIYILRYTARFVARTDTISIPSRTAMGPDYRTMPPEPRLQGVPGHDTDPQQDRRDKVQADNDANEKYGWIDEKAGVAQIPVKEAMKVIAAKGLSGPAAAPQKK